MPENSPIQVAFASDENYVQHMGMTILSLLHNINPDTHVKITVIGDNLSTESTSRLKQIVTGNKASIVFPEVNFDILGDLKVNSHFTRAMYGRLLISDIIDAEKVLYLDCDILIRADISDLWKIDISGYYSGAVIDLSLSGIDENYLLPGERVIPSGRPYFNSGVMLLNLKRCREDNLMQRVFKFVYQNSNVLHFPDQDALNVVLRGQWYPLDPCWNVQSAMFKMCKDDNQRCKLPQEVLNAVENPTVVHFTDTMKPWHLEGAWPYDLDFFWPYLEEYYKYANMSPWKQDKSSISVLMGTLRKHRRKFKRKLRSLF